MILTFFYIFQIQEHEICWKGSWLSQNSLSANYILEQIFVVFLKSENCSFSSWGADGGSYFPDALNPDLWDLQTDREIFAFIDFVQFQPNTGDLTLTHSQKCLFNNSSKNTWADLDQW